MVIHDQSIDISKDLSQLETDLGYLSMSGNCIHSAPLIRKELDYSNLDRETRKKIMKKMMKKMMTFFRRCPVKCKSFYIEKKNIDGFGFKSESCYYSAAKHHIINISSPLDITRKNVIFILRQI